MNIKLKKGITYAIIVTAFSMMGVSRKSESSYPIRVSNEKKNEERSEEVMAFRGNSGMKISNFNACDEANINRFGMEFFVQKSGQDRPNIDFYTGETYASLPGVTCFRGNNMRDTASYGTVTVNEEKLNILWQKNIGGMGEWTGVGWNGQPAIVKWNSFVIKDMNIKDEKKNKDGLKEVIYATLDGNVYFLDLEDGKETRSKLTIGAPIKGSVSVDPRGIPILYVGQGIENNNVSFAYRIFSLVDFSKLYEFRGHDSFARRDWGAFDSTALIDGSNDSIYLCGENGIFYSGRLNTTYVKGKVAVSPQIDKYRYDFNNKNRRGMENSIAIYNNYGFFADNDGMLQCLNLKTLKPVWSVNVNDDTDSTVVLDKKGNELSLFTACEIDFQGNDGYSYTRKIDGATGRILWENKYKCAFDDHTNGGALATPIVGKNDISNLVIYNIARTPSYNEGILIALDKESGREVWKLRLKNYCWSSPVALYTKEGKSYIVQCDSTGKAMLIEGTTGKILHSIDLGSNVEGSPAAFNNTLVVGTRGGKIIGFEVK